MVRMFAAVDEEALKASEALLLVVLFLEASSLLDASHPGVETVVSSTSSIVTGVFFIFTRA